MVDMTYMYIFFHEEKSQGELLCALPLKGRLLFLDKPNLKSVLEACLGSPQGGTSNLGTTG